MTEATTGGTSYFELPQRRPRSSGSEEAISPYSSPAVRPPYITSKPTGPRLRANWRTHSDSSFSRLHRGIATIQEEAPTHHSTPANLSIHEDVQTETASAVRGFSDSSSRPSTLYDRTSTSRALRRPRFSRSGQSSPGSTRSEYETSSRPTARKGSDSFARSSWADPRYRLSLPSSVRRKAEVDQFPIRAIEPLPPPLIERKPSSIIPATRIKIEKCFTMPKIQPQESATPERSSHRTSSINPRHFFSAPVNTFRKLKNRSNHHTAKRIVGTESGGAVRLVARDHKTSLQTQDTAALLTEVASLLKETKLRNDKREIYFKRTVSSSSSRKSRRPSREMDSSPALISRVRSMELNLEDTESRSSGSVEVRSRETPYNTPQEQAKYFVVNQNGEPEEYLKVDISIRGQTSYLPSEARRIHTPPLRFGARSGKRRGFFFDYSLPPKNQLQNSGRNSTPTREPQKTQRRQYSVDSIGSHVPSISRWCKPEPTRHEIKDWFTKQLAEVDSMVDEESSAQFSSIDLLGDHSSSPDVQLAYKCILDEERLDYSVPEHLPTSPLCPRHPKYWRVVRHKGSQFRGCWMHGFDEFDEMEKTRYGIPDAHAKNTDV